MALIIATLGLVVIFVDQLYFVGYQGVYGCLAMILAVILFAVSGVWLQKLGHSIPAFQLTTGSLWFAVPPLALAWWLTDGQLPSSMSLTAVLSIIYLGVMGSLIGFFLYYHLLQQISAFVVSTVGMISPVFALILGSSLADETLTQQMIWGTAMVLFAVSLYHKPNFRNLGAKT